MMKKLLAIVLVILLKSAGAQQNNLVVTGSTDSLHSKILQEQRQIWIHLPASAKENLSGKNRYPVVYLLDGDWNFTWIAGMIDFLSSVNGNSFWPEMIVVGILNTDRTRDLTPTRVTSGMWIDSGTARSSGGGEAFTAFIEKELIPHIDSLYPTTHYRIMIGHSLGGLMVMNTLVHHKNLFSSYIAIDPSMWWDQQKLLLETDLQLKTTSYEGTSLFLGMAHTQSPGMDTAILQRDTTEGTIHPRSILRLSRYLTNNRQNGLDADYKYYDGETHSSVPLISAYDALHFIFKDYRLNLQDSYFTDSGFRLAAFLKKHFENITLKYGITSEDGTGLLPPEGLVNNLGFYILGLKQFNKAGDLFEMNIRNYPKGADAYNYMGDLYSARNERKNAMASYEKSLSIKESADVRKKLINLQRE